MCEFSENLTPIILVDRYRLKMTLIYKYSDN